MTPQEMTPQEMGQRVLVEAYGERPDEVIANHMRLVEQPPPSPDQLSPGDVIVAIKSAAVGWVDLLMTSGLYQHFATPPYCPGLEYAGVVTWCGPEVDEARVQVGDRVIVDGFHAGPRSSGPYQQYGGFATYGVAPQVAIHRIPEALSFDQACSFLGSYETAYHCLVACGQLQAGETVLIHGASGAKGLAAVHVAKERGATVIATGRTDEKLDVVKAAGADHVVNIRGENKAPRKFRGDIKALTDGKGVDVVYDGVGGAISLESLRCVTFGARYLIVGWAATPFVAKGKGGEANPNMLPTNLIMMKGLQVLGCPTVIATQHDPSIREERLQTLMTWAHAGKLNPHVSHTFPLRDFAAAMKAKWEGKVIGGCTLQI